MEECHRHNDAHGDYWVVIESYVVDLSNFVQHHPGTTSRILPKKAKSTSNFVDHFGHTVCNLRQACRDFEATGRPVTFQFAERPQSMVTIVGKLIAKR